MAYYDIFTSAGEAIIVDLMDTATWYGDTGTGTGEAGKANTALGTAWGGARVSTTDTQPAADTFQMVWLTTYNAGFAITEAGIFDASTSGNLLIRSNFAAINVVSGDTITCTYQLQYS